MYHGNNVGHPLYPRTAGQTLTKGKFQKSQLIINLDPGWECQSLPSEENKKKRKGKFPIKEWEKAKKERKFPIKDRKKTDEICKKVFKPDNIWTIQNCHQVNKKKKENHDLKWSSPFDCQPKSCASVVCSPHTKQKQKRKRPRTLKAKIPTKKNLMKKSYWSMITHVIFDLRGSDL